MQRNRNQAQYLPQGKHKWKGPSSKSGRFCMPMMIGRKFCIRFNAWLGALNAFLTCKQSTGSPASGAFTLTGMLASQMLASALLSMSLLQTVLQQYSAPQDIQQLLDSTRAAVKMPLPHCQHIPGISAVPCLDSTPQAPAHALVQDAR